MVYRACYKKGCLSGRMVAAVSWGLTWLLFLSAGAAETPDLAA